MSYPPWTRPTADEHHEYYAGYIACVADGDFLELFSSQAAGVSKELGAVADVDTSICHAPYTWTLKQVVGHLIDAERVFGHRLHWIASGSDQPLAGMDQNFFVDAFDYRNIEWSDLVRELTCLRQANSILVNRLTADQVNRTGLADGKIISVRALAWIMAGHIEYHLRIIRKRLNISDP